MTPNLLMPSELKVDLTVPSQDLSLEAEFTPIRLTIETSVVGSGTVSSGGTYDMGESVSLTATPSGIDTTAPKVINSRNGYGFPLTETL